MYLQSHIQFQINHLTNMKNFLHDLYQLRKYLSVFIFSMLFFLLIFLGYQKLFSSDTAVTLAEQTLVILLAGHFISLIYMSWDDIKAFEISDLHSLAHVLILLILNLLGYIISFKSSPWSGYVINPFNNILAGACLGLIFWLIVKLTGGKGMGEGDIRIAAIVGLALGLKLSILAFYLTVFIGLLVGCILALRRGVFKGTYVPLVPCLALGAAIATYAPQIGTYLFHLIGI